MSRARPARRSLAAGRRRAPESPTPAESWALVLTVVSGVAVLPGALNRFVFPKLALAAAGVSVGLRAPGRGRLPRAVVLLCGVAVAALLVAALAAADPLSQLGGVAPRYEGLPTVLLYVGAALTGARLLGPGRHPDSEALLVRLLAGAAVAVASGAVLETVGWAWWESDVSRPGSLLGNASDQGAWGVLALGPLLLVAVRAPSRWPVAGLVGAVATVALSGSRGAMLGASVVVGVVLLAGTGRRARLVALGAWAVMAAVAVTTPGVRSRLAGDGLAGRTVGGRGELWGESWTLFTDHPLLGVGPGGFAEAVRGVHDASWYAEVGADFPPDSPHSWPLQALLAGGPVLLLAVLGLVVLTARAAYRVLRTDSVLPGLAAGLAGYGIALLFHFTGPGHTPLAALFAGALLAVPCAVLTRPALSMARAGSLAAAAVAVGTALGAVAEVPLRQAVVALADGDAASAEESFSTAQALRWWDPAVAVTAGHAYRVAARASGDDAVLQRAESWLTTGGDGASRPVSVLVDLGAVREARGELPAAAEALDAALDREPAHPESLLLRGVVAARQEDYDLAERLFRAAARSDPDSPAPWDNLARVYRATGRPADARAAEAESAGLR